MTSEWDVEFADIMATDAIRSRRRWDTPERVISCAGFGCFGFQLLLALTGPIAHLPVWLSGPGFLISCALLYDSAHKARRINRAIKQLHDTFTAYCLERGLPPPKEPR